ncbi:hypothetical protein [Kitasatospora mediocidica]|nr:hypothetical protein [Kitasatospora mediocidica]
MTNCETCGQQLAAHDPTWCFEIPARPTTDAEIAALPSLNLDRFHAQETL